MNTSSTGGSEIMNTSSTGGSAIFCIYTEMQLVIALLFFHKYLVQHEVKPYFILFDTVGKRFNTVDFSKLPGKHTSFKNELNQSVIFPDLSFLNLLGKIEDVRYVAYPNSPILTHEVISNYFAEQQPIRRIVIADGASIRAPWSLKAQHKLLLKYLVRRVINRVPHLSNRLLRSPDAISNADVLISTEPDENSEFVNVHTLCAEAENVRLALDLFHVPEWQQNAFLDSNVIFFGQPRLKDRIDDSTYFEKLNKIVDMVKRRDGMLIIKPHPAEDAAAYDFLASDKVIVCDTPIPAEFLLSSLRDKAVLSFYSSVSLMSGNDDLVHIWLMNPLPKGMPLLPDEKLLIIESMDEVEVQLDRVICHTMK